MLDFVDQTTGSVAEVLRTTRETLQHLPNARLEAELLLVLALGCSRVTLLCDRTRRLAVTERTRLEVLVTARSRGVPLAYLRGEHEFWSLNFFVNEAVLVPRAETEHLVALALAKLDMFAAPRVADLGTGSGALAVALAHERPAAFVIAVERDAAALEVAVRNVTRHQVRNVELLQASWLSALNAQAFEVILANPPYISDADPALEGDGVSYEPRGALTAGHDGLAALREISRMAPRALSPGGWLLLEHGATQGHAVRELLTQANFTQISTARDFAGHERVTLGQYGERGDG